MAAFVTLVTCLSFFDAPRKLFRDSDSGWHIRNGESILAGAGLPRSDPYSFSRRGREWFAWEWGADVLMGAAHMADGLAGVALLYVAAITGCTWLWFRFHWATGGSFLIACAMASPMLSTANLHWLARPHVFSWIFLLVWLLVSERTPSRFRGAHAAGVVLLTILWANIHASFFFLPLLAMLSAGAWWIRPLVWDTNRELDGARAKWFLLAATCSIPATFVTPYGWRLHAHLAEYLTNSELLSRVGEFQSFNFHAEGAIQILAALGLAAAGGVLALQQRRPDRFLMAVIFLALGMRSARALPLVALLLLPAANAGITAALREATAQRWIQWALDYSANLRRMEIDFRGYGWIPVMLVFCYLALHLPAVEARTGFSPDEFPVAAAAHVERLPSNARILAPDKYGGYLIYRFAGARPVFFDGRSDFYGASFMQDYIRLVQVRPGWRKQMEAHQFTHALLPVDYSLAGALEESGWIACYRDRVSVLLESPK